MNKTEQALLALLGLFLFTCASSLAAQGPTAQMSAIGGTLFYANSPGGNGSDFSIWTVDLTSGTSRKVIDLTGQFYWIGDLQVSSDGEKLAFNGSTCNGCDGEIYVMNVDGSNLHPVTSYPTALHPGGSRWSPGNPDILYYSLIDDSVHQDNVHLLNVSTLNDVYLFQGYGEATKGWDVSNDETEALMVREENCCWHPATFIAFEKLDGSSYSIIQPNDGTSDWEARINRQDGWIVDIEETQGTTGIADMFVMDSTGGHKMAVTNAPGVSRYASPIWASGGHTGYLIFMTTYFTGSWEIVGMTVNPTNWPNGVIHLSTTPGYNASPAWYAGKSASVINGSLSGATMRKVLCRNMTTGQILKIKLRGAKSWDCTAAGLKVNPGDRIKVKLLGLAD